MTVLLSTGAFDDHSFFVSGEHTKISELVSWGAGNYWRNLAQVHFSEHRCTVRIRFPDACRHSGEREIGRFGMSVNSPVLTVLAFPLSMNNTTLH